ncbi:MAG: hypothetical protein WC763_01230 [Candidatus Paceibacterota bacterium]|jgi:hypothetical protein
MPSYKKPSDSKIVVRALPKPFADANGFQEWLRQQKANIAPRNRIPGAWLDQLPKLGHGIIVRWADHKPLPVRLAGERVWFKPFKSGLPQGQMIALEIPRAA